MQTKIEVAENAEATLVTITVGGERDHVGTFTPVVVHVPDGADLAEGGFPPNLSDAEYDAQIALIEKDERIAQLERELNAAVAENLELAHKVDDYKRWQKQRADKYREQEKLGSRYVFSEIPMAELDAFKAAVKPYFNDKRFVMRVRGQHVKKTGLTPSQRRMAHQGHALEHCTHARVYIDEKVTVY